MGRGAKLTRETTQFGWKIKILFALDTVENRRRFEGLAFHRIEDVHPGHEWVRVPENAGYFRPGGRRKRFVASGA